jgi:hypothetical protein
VVSLVSLGRSKILLDVHEVIIAQVMIARCVCKCPLETAKKSLEKTLCTKMSFTSVSGCEGLRVSIIKAPPRLQISSFDKS